MSSKFRLTEATSKLSDVAGAWARSGGITAAAQNSASTRRCVCITPSML
jgi:hypothetical protein